MNVVIVVVLTALVELLGLPLLEFAIQDRIDASSRMGRLVSALLASILFIGRVKGSIAFLGALIAGFYTTDFITTRFQDEFIAFFLVYFAIIYTILDWIGSVIRSGKELSRQQTFSYMAS